MDFIFELLFELIFEVVGQAVFEALFLVLGRSARATHADLLGRGERSWTWRVISYATLVDGRGTLAVASPGGAASVFLERKERGPVVGAQDSSRRPSSQRAPSSWSPSLCRCSDCRQRGKCCYRCSHPRSVRGGVPAVMSPRPRAGAGFCELACTSECPTCTEAIPKVVYTLHGPGRGHASCNVRNRPRRPLLLRMFR